MICPKCKCEQIRVVDTMPTEDQRIFRRRKCLECGVTFRTVEIVCSKKFKPEKNKTGLTPVKEIPPKEYRGRMDNSSLCEEFMKMNVKCARVDISEEMYGTMFYAYTSLRQLIVRMDYPFYITTRNGGLYFVRTDME